MNTIERALMDALFVHLRHVFEYKGETIAVIPNQPPAADLEILNKV